MPFDAEFRRPKDADKLLNAIGSMDLPSVRIMEVCGTHTMAIAKSGLRQVLPPNVKLVSGPGCPVCVTPAAAMTGEVEVTILPPEGARYFRYMDTQKANNEILGHLFSTTEEGDAKLHESWPLDAEPGDTEGEYAWFPFYSYEAFRKIQPQDVPKLSIFVPSVQDVAYTAQLLVIHWYDESMNLIKREYIWETIEPFEIMSKGVIEDSEENLPDKPVKTPCIINSNLQHLWRGNWELVMKSYYQQGENARHYEFHIVDNKGNPVELPEDTQLTVYLPFPEEEGFDPYTASYNLRHYSANLYKDPGVDEDGEPIEPSPNDPDLNGVPLKVTVTEYGLKLETGSFSPFVLTWEGGEIADPTLPKTGDSTPVRLLGALCAFSALTAWVIKRRRHA